MATEKDSKLSEQDIQALKAKVDEEIEEKMKESGYVKSADFDDLLKSVGELKIHQMVNHKPCNDDNCAICGMKQSIDSQAFRRGIISGVQLGKKYPNLEVME